MHCMKYLRILFAVPVLSGLIGCSTLAVGDGKENVSGNQNICPADATFKSHVDEKLNRLSLEELSATAAQGNTDAMVLLGMRYTAGEAQNYEKAIALFQSAADKNNADGEYYMGVAYLNGLGVPKDDAKAAAWFRRGADHDHEVAQYWFGEMLSKGRGGLTADWNAALPYFVKAARRAVTNAFIEIGTMYNYGFGGLPVDYEKSASCFRVAARFGSQIAQYNVGLLVYDGKVPWQPGDPKPNRTEAPDVSIDSKK